MHTPSGTLTENGKFLMQLRVIKQAKETQLLLKFIERYVKVWVDMGFYNLTDGYLKSDSTRNVFKFLLEPQLEKMDNDSDFIDLLHNRTIP